MKTSALFITGLLMLTLTSCTPMARLIYGISEPEFVNKQQLQVKANDLFGQEEIPLFVVKYSNWKEGRLFSVPDMFVFNKHGNYIPYKDSLRPDCNGPANQFVKNLEPDKEYFISNEFNLESFLTQLESPVCVEIEWENEDVDFYIFFTFTTWTGKKLYKEKTKLWLQDLNNNNKIKYKVIAVSEDMMQCWSSDQKRMISGSN